MAVEVVRQFAANLSVRVAMRTSHRWLEFIATAAALDAEPADLFRERLRELGSRPRSVFTPNS